ncbi:MAG: flagellar FlbD family protein [Actinomycetota bacterium]|jgi:flagellar protein FlbD|nr:flagellar FlbD family protein [Actinomycetota bacterium]
MIALTRLNGTRLAINSDLIERVDASPDTVITLVDGTKYLVAESLDDVIVAVREFRAGVVARTLHDPPTATSPAPPLRVVSSGEES